MIYVQILKLCFDLFSYILKNRKPSAVGEMRSAIKDLKSSETPEQKQLAIKRLGDWLNSL